MPQRISPKHLVATTTGLCTALAAVGRWHVVRIVVAIGLALFWLAGAPTASAADPACCAVTSIAKSGQITARETRGARTFEFQVADPALRGKLRVGSPVYANFNTKQVSLDGKKTCCTILKISTAAKQPVPGTTPAAPRSPASLPGTAGVKPLVPGTAPRSPDSRAGAAGAKGVARAVTALPQLSFGTPQSVPTNVKTPNWYRDSAQIVPQKLLQFQNKKTVQLHGIDSIKQASGLSQAAQDILLLHARTLETQELDSYIVNPELAQEWSQTLPESVREKLRKAAEDTGKKKKKKGCSTKNLSTGCVKNEVDQAVDDVAKTARKAWEDTADEWGRLMNRVDDARRCFADHTLGASTPMKFSVAPEIPVSFEKDSKSGNKSGGASGSVSGTVTIGVPVNADFTVQAEMFYIPCVPFAIRPKSLGVVDGSLEVGGTFNASVNASGQFNQLFTVPPTGGVQIPVTVIPIMLGGVPIAVLDVSVYLDGTLEIDGKGRLNGNLKLQSMQKSLFDFECSGHGCTLNARNVPAPATAVESVKLDGRIRIKPAIYAALQLGLNYKLLQARAGPQPYLLGEIQGCAAATAAQSTTGTSSAQELYALTADLDWGIELRAEALAGGQKVAHKKWNLLTRHLYFKDLANSTALMPSIAGTPQPSLGQPAVYTMKMPQCYPYSDQMQYLVRWTGGASATTGAPNPGATQGRASIKLAQAANNSVPSTCSNLLAGQGTCWGAPLNNTSLNLAWPASGDYVLTVTPVDDKHGRRFDASRATQINIRVQP